jgi:sugar lactone lactonase YvrE
MQHDGGDLAYAAARVLATWPAGSFVENIAIDAAGTIFVTLHTDRAVMRVDPVTGAVAPFARFETPVAGLAFAADGSLIVSGGTPGQCPGVIWRVAPDGSVAHVADLPEAAFLNGVTPLGDRFLVADSLGGVIYAVRPGSPGARGDGRVTTWLADSRLAPGDGGGTPGANGIKIFGGHAYISVTARDTIYRAPVHAGEAGALAVHAERLRADDFAIDMAGALYIATHPARSLVRLAPDGRRTTLAGAEHGMVGATAVAFGRTAADREAVYVTTTGGTMTVPPEALEPAKLVRVEVGVAGAPLRDAA